MTQRISTSDDLLLWVSTHIGDFATVEEIDGVMRAIESDPKRPRWAADWTDYLAALPEFLTELAD